jgi:hypothetical protein
MYLEQAKSSFITLQNLTDKIENPRPCTLDNVSRLSDLLGLSLPKAYIEFLLWTGDGGGFFAGDEYDWERVGNRLKSVAYGLLEDHNALEGFPDDAVVIMVNQGHYGFAFIRISEGNNPPVHLAVETDAGLQFIWQYAITIEQWCLATINRMITAYGDS